LIDRGGYARLWLGLSNFILLYLIIRSPCSQTTRGRVHGRLLTRTSLNEVNEISSSLFPPEGTCGWYVFKFFEFFFGHVVLRHLMVVGMPRRRHWPARFRYRQFDIKQSVQLSSDLSDGRSFLLRNLLQSPIRYPLETPYVCTHRRGRGEAQQMRKASPDKGRIPCSTQRKNSSQTNPCQPTTSVPGRSGHVFLLPTLSLRDAGGCV
jgi:hypothetical protein